jgi:hypothetical protein
MGSIGAPELLILLVVLVAMLFWLWMLIECAIKEPSGSDKIMWLLIILVGSSLGAVAYFFARRPKRIQQFGE